MDKELHALLLSLPLGVVGALFIPSAANGYAHPIFPKTLLSTIPAHCTHLAKSHCAKQYLTLSMLRQCPRSFSATTYTTS